MPQHRGGTIITSAIILIRGKRVVLQSDTWYEVVSRVGHRIVGKFQDLIQVGEESVLVLVHPKQKKEFRMRIAVILYIRKIK